MSNLTEQYNEGEQEQVQSHGPGHDLKLAREQLRMGVTDVARQLRLSADIIKALENDDYSQIAPIYVCGYLRKYARLLGLPENTVVSQYEAIAVEAPPVLSDVIIRSRAKKNNKLLATSTFIIIVSLATLVALWWKSQQQNVAETTARDETPTSREQTVDHVPDEPSSVLKEYTLGDSPQNDVLSAEEVLQERLDEQADAADAVIMPQPQTAPGPGVMADSVVEPVPEETAMPVASSPGEGAPETRAVVAATPQVQAHTTGTSTATVTMIFSDDSWVELTDNDGQRLMLDLYSGGRRRSVTGTPPFTVLLGNASGVAVEYNGEPVDIGRYTRPSGTANFVLDEPN